MKRRKILFVAWDSPNVTYMEGLFLPIFKLMTSKYHYEFHIIHFTWSQHDNIEQVRSQAVASGIFYSHIKVITRPLAFVGKLLTVFYGAKYLLSYVRKHQIELLMPRSTMPAKMVLSIINEANDVKLVFDADGLPIEERVDFAGLREDSLRFRQLKGVEGRILKKADVVLTRTSRAAAYLSQEYGVDQNKFFQVINGRDAAAFQRTAECRRQMRSHLGISESQFVIAYCGSIGPQYGVDQMIAIFDRIKSAIPDAVFLIITNNPSGVSDRNDVLGVNDIILTSAAAAEIPSLLCAADGAFALRKDSFSMRGVSPIKIGEYLLMGLPVIASGNIGDTDQVLGGTDFVFILQKFSPEQLDAAANWIKRRHLSSNDNYEKIRQFGIEHFSLEKSASSYHSAISTIA